MNSLLYPPHHSKTPNSARLIHPFEDLGLGTLINALDLDGKHSRAVNDVLTVLNSDPPVIAYRQAILADLLDLPALTQSLTQLLPALERLASFTKGLNWGELNPLIQIGSRVAELEQYVNCVEALGQALEEGGTTVQAEGWLALRSFIAATRNEAIYQSLTEHLPQLRFQLEQAGSITVGINLDDQFRPEAATLLSINPSKFSGKGSLLERLLGGNSERGITPLYRATEGKSSHPEHDLFREMRQLIERAVAPVAEVLAKFTQVSSAALIALEPELAFYLGAVRLTERLRAKGFSLCRPTIAPKEEQASAIKGLYALDLVLRLWQKGDSRPIIPNDYDFDPEARIFILTGPNSGGKTTFTRAIGQAQVLFQAGLLVPGEIARLSPVDTIYTHFAAAESLDTKGGRLAEELERLAELFRECSRYSLLLLNEPLTSTDHLSARTLSRQILAGLRRLAARTIYVTHLHELVEDSIVMMETQPGAKVISLVAGITGETIADNQPVPTYQIASGQPQLSGYAAELARRYGLDFLKEE